nr:glyoxylate/hydroxypyruvate reductase A [Jannaschia marina]
MRAVGVTATILPGAVEHDPAEIDWIIYAPSSEMSDFSGYTRLKGVLCLWAGVEGIEGNRTLAAPLTRMVEPGLTHGMVEWVTGHVLRHHLGIDAHLAATAWEPVAPPLARDRPVAILGLGELGGACATALAALGFPVTGWSRSPKSLPGVRSLTGRDGLRTALTKAEIVVLLTPLTAETEGLMDARALGWMRDGAILLNPGRGALIDDAALLDALPRLGHATLDTFRVEPLPPDHPYWHHPKVTVTPHIASTTRPAGAARVVAENIRRGEAGLPLLHVVDRSAAFARPAPGRRMQ